MVQKAQTQVLHRLLGKRVAFQGKYPGDDQALLSGISESQQGLVVEELDASVDYLVVPDLPVGKTLQKRVDALNAKGAAVQVLDADGFRALVRPTDDELVQLMRGDAQRGCAG